MKTIYMDANTKSQFDIMTTKTKELFRDVIGMGLADCSPNLRLAYYQPVVFGLKRLVGADSSPAKSLSDELSNRFFWILKSYWMSTGGLPGKSESETIDKFMKVVELIKGRMVEQQTGAHLCSAKIEDHVIASVAVLLDVGSQDYVGLASDQLLSFDAVVFRPKEVHRDVALAHSDETPRLKYFKVNWFD